MNAGNAAALILVIMIIMVVYILVLPPAEREKLLEGNETEQDNGDDENGVETIVLLEEHVGRLDYVSEREYDHSIPSFYLYKTTNAVELRKVNPFVVRSAVFQTNSHNVTFSIRDLANTKNVMLTFHAKTNIYLDKINLKM